MGRTKTSSTTWRPEVRQAVPKEVSAPKEHPSQPWRAQTRFIRTAEVCERFSIGQSTVYRWIQRGLLPRPIRAGGRFSFWLDREVEAIQKAMTRGMEEDALRALAASLEQERSSDSGTMLLFPTAMRA